MKKKKIHEILVFNANRGRIRTFVLQRRHPTHGLPQVFQRVVLRHELMVRDALSGALHAVTLLAVPNSQVGLPVVLVHGEKSPTVLRAHVHGDFVRELVVDLQNEQNVRDKRNTVH